MHKKILGIITIIIGLLIVTMFTTKNIKSTNVNKVLLASRNIGYNTTANNPNNGYCFWGDINYNNPTWMAGLSNNVKLSQLSIPGTHDSMTYTSWGNYDVQTQTMNLQTQLNSGIRFIDIRLADYNHKLYLYHGSISLGGTFNEVLSTVTNFLKEHPTEVVFIRLAQASATSVSNTEFNNDTWNYLKQSAYWQYFFKKNGNGYANPKLGDMRNHFVILNYQQGNAPGINVKYDFNRQNNYNISTTWGLYGKWLDIKKQLLNANNRPNTTPYINYLSASGGGFPYFFASGHVTPSTWADFLWTGVLSNQTGYDSNFPRFGAGIYFEGTNFLTTKYLKNHNLNYVGFIPSDFPGAGLISSIINVNKHFFVNGIQIENGKPYIIKNGEIKTGWYYHNKFEYYLNPQTGQPEKGFQSINGLQFYFSPSTGVEEKGVYKTPDGLEYFNGNPSKNQAFGQAIYYTGWLTLNGNKYYFNPDSKAQTGWMYIGRNGYFFNPNGVLTAVTPL